MMNYINYYSGVGSRKSPPSILALMTQIAIVMESKDWILRSGGAEGADTAFEQGCISLKIIYYAEDAKNDIDAMRIASLNHPAWDACSPFAKLLHARNVYQVLGHDLKSPSKCVICWTPDGCTGKHNRSRDTGGTGTAICIAESHGIMVYNLARTDHLNLIKEKLKL